MNNAALLTNNGIAAIGGAIIAVYAILGAAVLLGAVSLIRLLALTKKTGTPAAAPKEDPALASELEKERAAREEAERALASKEENCAVCRKEKEDEIAALKKRIEELENAPKPEPQIVYVEKERTLKESLTAAKEVGSLGVISKKSIIEYLSEKHGDKVELVGRKNRTDNGKLLVSDNHFAFSPEGKRVCFTYVYETDDGHVVSLIKLDAPYASFLSSEHKEVSRSRFPKNKENDWYSVVADDSFTAESYYAVFDHAIALITGEEEAFEHRSLKESLAAAKETGAVGTVTKKTVIAHLEETFGEKVETNGRKNRTDNGKLLVSDNHFAFSPEGKRVCFTYVYEDEDGKITLLVKTSESLAKALRAAHKSAVHKSAFPKNKENDWYSVVVDESFTESDVYDLLDDAARLIIGEKEEEAFEHRSLKESLAAAKETGAVGTVTKKTVIAHLEETFGEKVETNGRKNRTDNGKLLVSDNHFAFSPEGKRVCFTYVYEDEDGKITLLVKTSESLAKALRAAHKSAVHKSAFPKNKENDWYSVVVDESFTESDVYDLLDDAARLIIGEKKFENDAQEEEQTKEEIREIGLKESLAAAKETGAVGTVTKKLIAEHLAEAYGEKVAVFARKKRTDNGKLYVPDNHFAVKESGNVCFTYVYEDDAGYVLILAREDEAFAKKMREAHGNTVTKSAFPKNKAKDWYSFVVDESYTENEVWLIFDEAIRHVVG